MPRPRDVVYMDTHASTNTRCASLQINVAGDAGHAWAHDVRAVFAEHGPLGAAGGVGEGNGRVGLGDRDRLPGGARVLGAQNHPTGKLPVEDQGQEGGALGEGVAVVKHAVAQGGGPCTVPLVHSVDEVVRGAPDADVAWLGVRQHGEANVHAGVDEGAVGAIDIPPSGVLGVAGGVEAAGADLVVVVLDDPVAEFALGMDLAVGTLLEVMRRPAVGVLERESAEGGIVSAHDSRKLGRAGVGDFQIVYPRRNDRQELSDCYVGRERELGVDPGHGGGGGGGSVGGLFEADLDSGLAVGAGHFPVQAVLGAVLGSLDAVHNGPAAVADDPGAARVLVQEDVVKRVVHSDGFVTACGDVVHDVVDMMQVLVGGTAGDGLERTVQEGREYVLALGTKEGGDLVYVVAG